VKRPALLVRFPSLRQRVTSHPILARDAAADYPELAEDIEEANRLVAAAFEEADRAALVHQNRYRRQQVVIILGTALLSGLGGLQAVLPDERWPGAVLIVLGLALTFVGRTAGELGTFETFLDERVKAERLRSAYFRYLSRTGLYKRADRTSQLRRAVVAIKKGEEPG
jgi:hypothetical protein